MKKILFIFCILASFLQAQTPNGTRKVWADTLKVSRGNQFVDILSIISDSTRNADGVTIVNSGGTFQQKVFADSNAVKAIAGASGGTLIVMTSLDSSNPSIGGGMFRKVGAGYGVSPDGWNVLAASGGGYWVRVNFADLNVFEQSDTLTIKAGGVTNTMLAGSIADSKLNQITTTNKVAGSAVQLSEQATLTNNTGLQVKEQALDSRHLSQNTKGSLVDIARAGSRSSEFYGNSKRTNIKVVPVFTLNNYNVVSDSLKILYRYTSIDTVGQDTLTNLATGGAVAAVQGNLDVSDGIAFTADTSHRAILDGETFDFTSNHTFEFLFSLTSTSDFTLFSITQASSNTRYYRIFLTSAALGVEFRPGVGPLFTLKTTSTLKTNTVYHAAIVKDNYAYAIYLNGVKEEPVYTVATTPSFGFDDTTMTVYTRISLNSLYRNNAASAPGAWKLYEYKYYNRNLSDVEVEANYEKSKLVKAQTVTETYPVVDGGLYEFPVPLGVLHPVGTPGPWSPPIYNKYTNSIDAAWQGRITEAVSADTNYISMLKFDLRSMAFNYPLVVTYQNKTGAATGGSKYDYEHNAPYVGLDNDDYIVSYGAHNTVIPFFRTDHYYNDISAISQITLNTGTYQIMSTEFDDEIWMMARSNANTRRAFFKWSNKKWTAPSNAVATGQTNGRVVLFATKWPYIQRPWFGLRGTKKRAVMVITAKDPSRTSFGYHEYGIMEIEEDGVGGYNYYDKAHRAIQPKSLTIVDDDTWTDSCLVYTTTSDSAYSWGETIVDGDSIAFGLAEDMANRTAGSGDQTKVRFYRRKGTAGSWEAVNAMTDSLQWILKLWDYTYDPATETVWILWGSSGWKAPDYSDLSNPRIADTLFLSKITSFWGASPAYSVTDTIFTDATGDSVGVVYCHFVRGFLRETGNIAILINKAYGAYNAQNTAYSRYYYYFKKP